MGRPSKVGEGEELKSILIRTSETNHKLWKTWAIQQGKTMTSAIEFAMVQVIGGEIASLPSSEEKRAEVKQAKITEKQLDDELEISEMLMDVASYCWPVGEIRKVTKDELRARKFHSKIKWVDEVENCYDEDMYCWEADGTYNALKQVGGGTLRWQRTIVPALEAGWEPREPVSELTTKRVLYVLANIKQPISEKLKALRDRLITQREERTKAEEILAK